MKKLLVLSCVVGLISFGFVQAATFSHEFLERAHPNRCSWFDRGTHFVMHTSCQGSETVPQLSLKEAMETLRPYIKDVTNVYSVDDAMFYYTDAEVVYSDELYSLVEYWSQPEHRENETNSAGWLTIPKAIIAYQHVQTWSTFASVRDVSTYGYCRLTNYKVAMAQLDGVEVQPGELLNMNKIIARQPGYCTGGQNFLFYQGACGGSTQLFWNGMLNPFLEVTKRSAHGMWYAGFYGSNILGDDASMYERGKQMEVKNIGDKSLYLMTFVRDDGNTVLLSIYPGKHDMKTLIQKQQTGEKSAVVSSTVFDKHESVVYSQERVSNYRGIDTSVDETAGLSQ